MSRPLAATFVATRIGALPERKSFHHTLPCVLAEVALERPDRIAHVVELLRQPLDAVLGLSEDDDRGAVPLVQQVLEDLNLVALADGVNEVFHRGQGLQVCVHFRP